MAGFSIALVIEGEELPHVRRAAEALRRPELRMVAGRGVRNRLQDHFQKLEDTRPNKKGWPRQHLWSQARRSVQAPVPRGAAVVVAINHVAVAQRYFGGVIRARNVKYLTIPMRQEAYGKRAREFNNLGFAIVEGLGPALVQNDATLLKRTKKGYRDGGRVGGAVMYLLRQRVTQKEDRTVLPTQGELEGAAVQPVLNYLDREERK